VQWAQFFGRATMQLAEASTPAGGTGEDGRPLYPGAAAPGSVMIMNFIPRPEALPEPAELKSAGASSTVTPHDIIDLTPKKRNPS
jgi:hypothetical protein